MLHGIMGVHKRLVAVSPAVSHTFARHRQQFRDQNHAVELRLIKYDVCRLQQSPPVLWTPVRRSSS